MSLDSKIEIKINGKIIGTFYIKKPSAHSTIRAHHSIENKNRKKNIHGNISIYTIQCYEMLNMDIRATSMQKEFYWKSFFFLIGKYLTETVQRSVQSYFEIYVCTRIHMFHYKICLLQHSSFVWRQVSTTIMFVQLFACFILLQLQNLEASFWTNIYVEIRQQIRNIL